MLKVPAQSCPLVQHPPLAPSLPSTFFALPLPPSKASRQHFVATELKLVSSPSGTQREWQLTLLFPGDSDLIRAGPRHCQRLKAAPLCGQGVRGGGPGPGLGALCSASSHYFSFGLEEKVPALGGCCGCELRAWDSLRNEARTCWSRPQMCS